MTADLRTRIAAALADEYTYDPSEHPDEWAARIADAVIRELVGISRRCERCRHDKPLTDFPPPRQPGGALRPFCTTCTNYVEWATS